MIIWQQFYLRYSLGRSIIIMMQLNQKREQIQFFNIYSVDDLNIKPYHRLYDLYMGIAKEVEITIKMTQNGFEIDKKVFETKTPTNILKACFEQIDQIAANNFRFNNNYYSPDELEIAVGYFYTLIRNNLAKHPEHFKDSLLNKDEIFSLKRAEKFLINKQNIENILNTNDIALDQNSSVYLIKKSLNIALPDWRVDQNKVTEIAKLLYGKIYEEMVEILYNKLYDESFKKEKVACDFVISKYNNDLAEISRILSLNEKREKEQEKDSKYINFWLSDLLSFVL